MMIPRYDALKGTADAANASVTFCSGSSGPRGNPRFHKYYWRIFSLECPWEDHDFFRQAPILCNADFEKEIRRLLAKNLSCMVYGFHKPRSDPANPWDISHAKWKNVEFAPSWEEDTDPVVEGGYK
jgi:hypothetical protein